MFVFTVKCTRIGRRKFYRLDFPFNKQIVGRIQNFPKENRNWDSKDKIWELKVESLFELIKSYKKSQKIFFDFGGEENKKTFIGLVNEYKKEEKERYRLLSILEEDKKRWLVTKKEVEENYEKYWDLTHKNLKEGTKLYPHQVAAVMYLNEVRNALLAFSMGTGKSLISISYSELNEFKRVMIITPNSLKFNYYYEVEKFTNSKAHVVGWKKNKYTIEESKYIITNYDFFNPSDKKRINKKWKNLNITEIDCVVFDECHRLTSTKSNTYTNIERIFKNKLFRSNKPSKIYMSGTPASSRAYQLYGILHQISPLEFTTKEKFYTDYCGMHFDLDDRRWVTNIAQADFIALFKKIEPYVYRKKKSEVLKDLPEKTEQVIYLEMSPKEQETYDKLEAGVANDFYNEDMSNPLKIMGKLREYTSYLKVKNVQELIDSIVDTGEKLVLIDFYKESLRELHKKYPKISKLHTGDVKEDIRSEIVKEFQDPYSNLKIFLGSESTSKEGLTLTEANKMGVLTIPYVPGTLDQVEDRLSRIGQKNAVSCYLFVYRDSIDEHVYDLIESKRYELSQAIDGEKYSSMANESVFNDLVKIIKEKHKKN